MILYFSATGNSEYIARNLAVELDNLAIDLFTYIKEGKSGIFDSDEPFVLVSPTYSWRLPRFLSEFLTTCTFKGSRDFYVVMDYGDSCGNAYKYIEKDMDKLGLNFMGLYSIKMPENCIMLFDLDSDDLNKKIIADGLREVGKISSYIKTKQAFPKKGVGLVGKFQSSIINPIFSSLLLRIRNSMRLTSAYLAGFVLRPVF
ncbi:flavodoxin domain-containing protein [Anaerococcus sp. NML200537]|nr:flavodoxin domain-containing protein [Anaerococcus sp. NML200537]MCW6700827.1 flavodoxin domain-containing protein [Anaerococcus sp. NML200537]